MEHSPRHLDNPAQRRHQVTCSCQKFSTEICPTRQLAEDAYARHTRQVEQARCGLQNRNPSLKVTLTYYREQQNNPENSKNDRAQWKVLADEVERRLGHVPTVEEQPALPFG